MNKDKIYVAKRSSERESCVAGADMYYNTLFFLCLYSCRFSAAKLIKFLRVQHRAINKKSFPGPALTAGKGEIYHCRQDMPFIVESAPKRFLK